MKRPSALKAPFLKRISMLDEKVDAEEGQMVGRLKVKSLNEELGMINHQ